MTDDKEENGEDEDGVKSALGGRDRVGHFVLIGRLSKCLDCSRTACTFFSLFFFLTEFLGSVQEKAQEKEHSATQRRARQ